MAKCRSKLPVTCILTLLAALAAGPASASDLHLVGRMGIDGGGDRLAKVTMSDGSSQTITAGGLFTIGAGLVYMPRAAPIAVEATLGYKVDDITASNGSMKFSRWPIELLASYVLERHRIGGGLAQHRSPTFACSVSGVCSGSTKAPAALGAVAQYGYGDYSGQFVWDIGLRLTFINYKFAEKISGNSVGGFVSFGF